MTTKTRPLRILVVDDHDVMRQGTSAVIERQSGWEVCGFASTGREAVEKSLALKPHVVVMDENMPVLNGLEATRQIKRRLPKTEILIFTADETEEMIKRFFDCGAKSVIFKAEAHHFLVDAIESLSRHKPFFTTKVAEVLFGAMLERSQTGYQGTPASERLTEREREVVQLLAEGHSNKGVAGMLGISLRTAENHRATLLHKLSLDSLASLVRYAIRNRIIKA
jgi:DNA-binding NarL/FixJ family response regulator